jgi:hypothetical protein
MKSIRFKKLDNRILDAEKIHNKIDSSLNELKDGVFICTLKLFKENRNNSQNALMWLWFKCLEEETGQERAAFYQHYCEKYLPEKCTYLKNGEFVSGNTSKLKTNEFAYFMKQIESDAASEFGYQLPINQDLIDEENLRKIGNSD